MVQTGWEGIVSDGLRWEEREGTGGPQLVNVRVISYEMAATQQRGADYRSAAIG